MNNIIDNIIDNITIICPTHDNLEYLKLFYYSYIKAKDNFKEPDKIDIIIGINGEDKKSELFCINNNIKHTTQKKLGMYSATNLATKNAVNGYLIIANDDIYLDVMFFNRLYPWLSPRKVLISNSIQPNAAGGTFTPWYNWGETYENFNKDGFLKYCREIEIHKSSFHNFGVLYAIHSTDWFNIDGFDEIFDPWGGGMADLMYRLFLSGIRNFLVLHDVLHYHFIRKCRDKHFNKMTINKKHVNNFDKWGITNEDIDKIIKEGCTFIK